MNSIDVNIGKRIRNKRHILGLSQNDLAEKLGITFQQIQKYEKGQNKVMASRLFELSKILNVDISYFFVDSEEDFTSEKKSQPSLKQEQTAFLYELPDNNQNKVEKDTIKLIKLYSKIKKEETKRKLLHFLKSIVSIEE